MAILFDSGIFSVVDNDGSVGAGWKLAFYQTGTATARDTYPTADDADAATNPNANPVIANASGRFPAIWLADADYKVILKSSVDVVKVVTDPAVGGGGQISQITQLRNDLAATTGLTLIGAPEANAYDLLYNRTALAPYAGAIKPFARSWGEAIDMAEDLSDMRGFAAHAGTTGGQGEAVYKVWNQSDDEDRVGSFRWAVAQATAAGEGQIIFAPFGKFTIQLRTRIILTDNITVDAPGRNVRIGAFNDVELIRMTGENIIFRRINLFRYPYYTHEDDEFIEYSVALGNMPADRKTFPVTFNFDDPTDLRVTKNRFERLNETADYTVTGGGGSTGDVVLRAAVTSSDLVRIYGQTYGQDGISIKPDTANKIWIDECTLTDHTDGAIDIASSLLVPASSDCNVTISRCVIRHQDKCMVIGSTAPSLTPAPVWSADALAQTPKCFVTLDSNFFEGSSQRNPSAWALSYVHSVNNVHVMAQYRRGGGDDDAAAVYGARAATGGRLLSEADYFRHGSPYAGTIKALWCNLEAYTADYRTGPGALRASSTVAETGMVMEVGNTDEVDAPPYSLTSVSVPSSEADRIDYVYERLSQCGAEMSPLSEMNYAYIDKASGDADDLYVDGYNVTYTPSGYRVRMLDSVPAVDYPSSSSSITITDLSITRGSSLTIASGVITVGTSSVFAIDTEAAAATDDLVTINGGVHGDVIGFRLVSASRTVVVKQTGNIISGGDIFLDNSRDMLWLYYDDGVSGWAVIAAPSSTTTGERTVAQLPAAGFPGRRSYVTDANSTTFLATAVGGGANKVPVIDNGSAWVIG